MKISTLILALTLVFSFSACSSSKVDPEADSSLSEEEINSKYEQMIKEDEAGLLDADYNPITDSFTPVDFQITKTDDTTAFNLPENSFATITQTKTDFSFFDKTLPSDSFIGEFKTAKGVSLSNTVNEIIGAYKTEWKNIISRKSDGLYVEYNEDYDAEVISFGFKSDDALSFSPIRAKDLLKVLQTRDFSGDGYVGTKDIETIVKGSQTVAIVDIIPSPDAKALKIKISRFDKIAKDE